MLELLTVYFCKFRKREPLFIAASSIDDVILRVKLLPNYEEGELIYITETENKVFV